MIDVVHGDARTVVPTLGRFHACVTDTPYEIGIAGRAWDRSGVATDPETWAMLMQALEPGAHLVAFGASQRHHRVWCAVEDGGFEIRDTIAWLHAQGTPKTTEVAEDKSLVAQLKPACELILLARRPLEMPLFRTVAETGIGALHVDACRVEGARRTEYHLAGHSRTDGHVAKRTAGSDADFDATLGRFPSNVVLTHAEGCTEDRCEHGCPALELDQQSGLSRDGVAVRHRGSQKDAVGLWSKIQQKAPGSSDVTYGGGGGASRYYPSFRFVRKASIRERDIGLTPGENDHPTVKPLNLMRWLVRLVAAPGQRVLDPFCGSGTTLMACAVEGMVGVGCDLDERYVGMARRRALAGLELAGRLDAQSAIAATRPVQVGIFGGDDDG